MKLIKRYSNRKLYDTERSCYVTLDEIAEMVRDGDDVRIVDNRSGEDLTTVTLAQIVYEEEKRDRKLLPLQSLRMIIQSPADFLQRISKPVTDFRDETQRQVERMRERAATQQEEFVSPIREFIDSVQRRLDLMGSQFDERLKDSVDGLSSNSKLGGDVEQLRAQVRRLEKELADLQRRVDRGHGGGGGRPLPSRSTHDNLPGS